MPTSVLRRTAGQLFMVNLPGPVLDRATRDFLAEQCPGGVILFKRNIRSAEQLRRLVADIHATGAGVPPLVALDHEGGRVDRLPHPPFTHFPPMATVAERGDAKLAVAVGRAMGRELRAVGIDLDFAPVLDVWSNPRNRVIGDRAFGTTPQAVARFALAFARGLAQAGVLACGKHFPGHGATVGDSHFVLPRVRRSRREFAAVADAGVTTLATIYHACHRQICDAGEGRSFEIVNFMEILGEGLGLFSVDLYKRLKLIGDIDEMIVETAPLIEASRLDLDTVRDALFAEFGGNE